MTELAGHEREYINEKPLEPGTRVEVDTRNLPERSICGTGKIVESPFDVGEMHVGVKLDNPVTYANCRIVHKIAVSHETK